ncbi:MAG: S8 family serine peptidase [Actinomycetota bacterium]
MLARSLRRALVAPAALLLLAGTASPTSAEQSRSNGARDRSAGIGVAELPRSETSRAASVDRRVARALAAGGSVEALLVLEGDGALTRARAAAPPDDSRALLRSVVPRYRDLKAGVRSRLPDVTVLRDYRTLPILFVRLPSRSALERAASDPAVAGIGANVTLQQMLTESLPLIGQPAAAAAGHTGAGTAVAVLDSGADYTRAAFGSCSAPGGPGCRVVVAQDFAPDDGQLDDEFLHGTNVAGIVAAVAPDTQILSLDVFDDNGASVDDVIAAIDFSIANQATFNIRAMNLSLGDDSHFTSPCGGGGNPFVAAFSNARAAGILPIVASGNDAEGSEVGVALPACTPGAVSVGAVYDSDLGSVNAGGCTDNTTKADKVTCFSQRASFLTVLAPGARIRAAEVSFLGTSQATPHVAGGVAVLVDSRPESTPSMVESAIRSSGPLVFDPLMDASFHRLDLPAAIATLAGLPVPPPGTCTIEGDAQGNRLQGTAGDDVICGEGGDDVILASGGNDLVIGGPGFDFVSLEEATGGGTIDLTAGTAIAPGISVTLEGVEGGLGSAFADTLIGNGEQNEFFGLGGNDLINGMNGFDLSRYDFSTKRIRADLSQGVAVGQGSDELISVEGLTGSSRDDELVGDGNANALFGLKGDDLLGGLGKDDTLVGGPGADRLIGGRGNDDLFGGPGRDSCDQGPGSGTASSC